jgi:hypothetical protein
MSKRNETVMPDDTGFFREPRSRQYEMLAEKDREIASLKAALARRVEKTAQVDAILRREIDKQAVMIEAMAGQIRHLQRALAAEMFVSERLAKIANKL